MADNKASTKNRTPNSQRRGKSGLLNQTVNIGGNNTSVGTILIIVIGAIAIFGTSWASGFFSPIGIATVINVLALLVAWEKMDDGFWSLITQFLAFVLVFNIARTLIRDVFPRVIVQDSQNLGEWDQLIDEYKVNMPLKSESAADGDLLDNLFPVNGRPDYSFDGTDPQVLVTPTTDANYGGSAPAPSNTAVDVNTTPLPPVPTPTPDPVVALLYDLNTAVSYHDKAAAQTAAQSILRIEPNNVQAKAVLSEVSTAEATLINKQHMPVTASWVAGDTDPGRVARALAGGTYTVLSEHNVSGQIALACEKIATIEETGGWLNGEQYQVKWCLLDQFDVKRAGDKFTVPGR